MRLKLRGVRGATYAVAVVLALALAMSIAAQPAEAKSVEELLVIACGGGGRPPELVPELRAAAAVVLSDALLVAGLDLAALERIATGPTVECRQSAISALMEAYLALDPEKEGSAPALLAGVATAPSLEIAYARALAAIVRIQQTLLVVGLPPTEELVGAITAVLSGGAGTLLGFTVDGANPIIRAAVGRVIEEFLFFLARTIYGDAVCQVFADLAVNAPTAEFRTTAARVFITSGCAPFDVESLTAIVTTAPSEELRDAAVETLAETLVTAEVSDDDLQKLALNWATTHQHRLAAGLALGMRWMMRLQVVHGRPFVDSIDLIKFAVAHSFAHPELAAAAIAPLAVFFSA